MNTDSPLLGDILLFCIVGSIVAHTLSLICRGKLLLLDPLFAFWAGVAVVYVSQPLSYRDLFIKWHSEAIFEATLGWVLLAILCVIWGYEWNLGARLGLKLPAGPARLSATRLSLAGYGLIALSAFGYVYLFNSAGGASEWLSVGRGGTDYDNISGYIAQLADLLPIGVLLLLFQINFHSTPPARKILVWILTALVWWWFLYLGSRSRLIGMTIGAMAAYYLPKGKSPPPLIPCVVFLVLFILGNFQEAYRDKFTNLSLNLDQIDLREARENILPGFLGGNKAAQSDNVYPGIEFNCVMSVIELVPDKVPYNYGYGFLDLFTRWVPRAVWPNKIYPQMEAVQGVLQEGWLSQANVRDSDILMGPAFTFVGYWFYVGGAVGLVAGGLLTGVLFRTIRTIYDRGRRNEGDILIYASLISIGFSDAASTPLAWVTMVPLAQGPLILILYLCRATAEKRKPRGFVPWSEMGNRELGQT